MFTAALIPPCQCPKQSRLAARSAVQNEETFEP